MNDDDKKAAFDHPCRETCSGWRQGFDRGQSDLRNELMKGAPAFDEAAADVKIEETLKGWTFPDVKKRNNVKRIASELLTWQHEQSRLREAAFKQDSERAEQFAREEAARRFDLEQERDAALAQVERLKGGKAIAMIEDLEHRLQSVTVGRDQALAEVERLKADAKPLVLAEVHRTYAERDQLRAERDEYKKLAEHWMRDHDALKDKYEPTVLMEQGLRAEVERMGNELNWGDRELKDRACEIDRLKRELIEANATCVKVSRLGTEELTAERAKAQAYEKALEHYAKLEDWPMLPVIARDAIAAYKETK